MRGVGTKAIVSTLALFAEHEGRKLVDDSRGNNTIAIGRNVFKMRKTYSEG